MPVEINGWGFTFFYDCDLLEYCENCEAPDGRIGALATWQRHGTDPAIALKIPFMNTTLYGGPVTTELEGNA